MNGNRYNKYQDYSVLQNNDLFKKCLTRCLYSHIINFAVANKAAFTEGRETAYKADLIAKKFLKKFLTISWRRVKI